MNRKTDNERMKCHSSGVVTFFVYLFKSSAIHTSSDFHFGLLIKPNIFLSSSSMKVMLLVTYVSGLSISHI